MSSKEEVWGFPQEKASMLKAETKASYKKNIQKEIKP